MFFALGVESIAGQDSGPRRSATAIMTAVTWADREEVPQPNGWNPLWLSWQPSERTPFSCAGSEVVRGYLHNRQWPEKLVELTYYLPSQGFISASITKGRSSALLSARLTAKEREDLRTIMRLRQQAADSAGDFGSALMFVLSLPGHLWGLFAAKEGYDIATQADDRAARDQRVVVIDQLRNETDVHISAVWFRASNGMEYIRILYVLAPENRDMFPVGVCYYAAKPTDKAGQVNLR